MFTNQIKGSLPVCSQKEHICLLPVEDTVWIIGKSEYDDEDNEDVWAVFDSNNVFIGAYTQKQTDDLKTCVETLLKDCMTLPLSWKPRRPKFVSYKDDESKVSTVDFSQFEIIYIDNIYTKVSHYNVDLSGSLKHHHPMQSCSVCRRRGSLDLFEKCKQCMAIYYCSEQCMNQDKVGMLDCDSHEIWCEKMKYYVEQTVEMLDMPFTFTSESTSPTFDDKAYKDFQGVLGVYGKGLWKREGPCPRELGLPIYGELLLETLNDDYVLHDLIELYSENETSSSAEHKVPDYDTPCLNNWKDYYKWRGLEMNSPAAILMQWPLTIYHIITNLIIKDYPHKSSIFETEHVIKIHIIGAEKEVDLLPVFHDFSRKRKHLTKSTAIVLTNAHELQKLMPNKSFEVLIVGCNISRKCHRKNFTSRNINYTIEKGFYHTTVRSEANVVIGFNAGLGAYQSWMDTLKYLKQTKTPAYFTDYCHYSCECAKPPMKGLKLGNISEIKINPFRCPVRKYSEGNAFPWYSNGFMYCLLYADE